MTRIGTSVFLGLNSQAASDKLEDGELQQAQNVSWDEHGAAKPVKQHSLLYNSSGTPRGLDVCHYGGNETLWYKAAQNVYEDGTLRWASGNDAVTRFLSSESEVFALDGVENKVYDGTTMRDHGAPQNPGDHSLAHITLTDSANVANYNGPITDITLSTSVITSAGCGAKLEVGDKVLIKSVTGTTEINGHVYEITAVDTDTFTLGNVDMDNWTAYGSGGTWYLAASGLSDSYTYAVAYCIELAGGRVIEGPLNKLGRNQINDATSITVSDTERVEVVLYGLTAAERAAYIEDATGATFKYRLYRTKGNGDSYYLHSELDQSDFTEVAPYFVHTVTDQTPDSDLGALFIDGDLDAHGQPPVSALGLMANDRMYLKSATNENRIYWSAVGAYDYFRPLSYLTTHNDITGLAPWGSEVVVFNANAIYVLTQIDNETAALRKADSPVGTTDTDSVVWSPYGVFFANDRGLWLFTGNDAIRVSDKVQDAWQGEAGSWRGEWWDMKAYYAQGSSDGELSYVLDRENGGARWSVEDVDV